MTQGKTPPSEVEAVMANDHAHLEQLFQAVMVGLRGGDPDFLRARWVELDRALERHLRAEEELLLPDFERAYPTSAARLRRDHRSIRAALVQLGVDLDLHELSPESAARFIAALRGHASYEDSVLYPWAHHHLGEAGRRSLIGRIRHAGEPSGSSREVP